MSQLPLFPPDPESACRSDGFVEAFQAHHPNLSGALAHRALEVAGASGSVTADDLRALVPDGLDRRIVGAVFAHLVKSGLLKKVAYTQTSAATSHRRPIARFSLTGEAQ